MTFIYNFQVEPPTFGVTVTTAGNCILVAEVGPLSSYEATINAAAEKLLGLKDEVETLRTSVLDQL